jgi:syntaxin 5
MGELFTQMSSLVMEQAETVLRIEDDVEVGLADTTEAHAGMLNVYEITRGNRGVIIKVFLLLIFFIVLFLVLT